MADAVNETAWIVGFLIAGAVVVVVVLLLGTIIYLGRRIERQAREIVAALEQTRENTGPLWEVQATNLVARELLADARRARSALGG
ncbi:MAG TPA: hypothetical protein VHL78_08365 [Actinomycetota bacterium]|nr:hypothetical protein [Actinomycetota bacterium]